MVGLSVFVILSFMSAPIKASDSHQEFLNFKLGDQQAFGYSEELQLAISDVLATSFTKDELDRPDFSPIDFINQTFPDGMQLNLTFTCLRIGINLTLRLP